MIHSLFLVLFLSYSCKTKVYSPREDPYELDIFSFILQADPPVLTLVSGVVLVIVLIDLLVPIAVRMLFKNENWLVVI